MSTPAEQAALAPTGGKQTTMTALRPASSEGQLAEVAVGFTSLQAFTLLQRVATMFSNSSIVPQRFQSNIANCAIAVEMAHRLRASPLMVMQNLYIVHGQPGWAAKFLIACFNQCGRYTSIKYVFQGTPGKDDWGARATATELSTGEKLEGPLITIDLAKKEGWHGRKDSKWQTMPEQMLRYRSGAWFINTTAPEISMGLRTEDELADTYNAERGPDDAYSVTTESLRQAGEVIEREGAGEQQPIDNGTPPGSAREGKYDTATAIAELKKAKTMDALNKAFEAVALDFRNTNRDLPVEVEAAFNDRVESIKQQ